MPPGCERIARPREPYALALLHDVLDHLPEALRREITDALNGRTTARFVPVSLGWQNVTTRAARQPDQDQRRMRILDWGAAERRLHVGAGEESILRVPENQNPGWQATLDGVRLEKVAVDGWQQGYVVPAGQGGTVELAFAPDRIYRAGLVVDLRDTAPDGTLDKRRVVDLTLDVAAP